MTHDERIEAMLKAWRDAPYSEGMSFDESDRAAMQAAWYAADVEGMVRKAMWLARREDANCRAGMPALGDDEMVERVMQGAG